MDGGGCLVVVLGQDSNHLSSVGRGGSHDGLDDVRVTADVGGADDDLVVDARPENALAGFLVEGQVGRKLELGQERLDGIRVLRRGEGFDLLGTVELEVPRHGDLVGGGQSDGLGQGGVGQDEKGNVLRLLGDRHESIIRLSGLVSHIDVGSDLLLGRLLYVRLGREDSRGGSGLLLDPVDDGLRGTSPGILSGVLSIDEPLQGRESLDVVLGGHRFLDGGVHLGEHEAAGNVELLEGGGRLGVRSLQALAVTAPRGVEENAREVSATDLVVEVVNGELERLECVVATLLLRSHDAGRERQRQTKQNQQILVDVHVRRSPHVVQTQTKETKERESCIKEKEKTSSNARSPE
mmetsp:Transcript_10473/g.28707  ORF Transcript_10473/g.28707 Transcript_10473/m.28707 type:complete len:351 (+) Transcript_10473:2192-3244(+)